ncbi:3'(2'),5'-bisphosphate nucleotidase CysQ [Fulvivirgaceae bacterium PWU5]|uniref:3'(2'),5'-bisphosphate nucleotidase CysQ n=1 Tax=Dawidia cretensis TaxID=2782350 RepID=A0AAP2DTY7_9BACT|nr:3'(2'),5'-bisphosphate nucleotidase CysQ [Dawidia cretensis]MBT1707408.1 3'(2'),5'-bisphosphate nucleotidase CysQ [Dawidia cretensis]
MDLHALLPIALRAAREACQVILDVYTSGDFQAEAKGDQSPVTRADKLAHAVIAEHLAPAGLFVLSEEGKEMPYDTRKDLPYFWMVDPLDGTKEFLKRNGEFTVNIAIIHQQRPVLGVVAVPVSGDVYYAVEGHGAFRMRAEKVEALTRRTSVTLDQPRLRVVASRSYMNAETKDFVDALEAPSLLSKGSSLKFLLLAEGAADVYPRYAPTMEWDTAAPHVILHETGLRILEAGLEEELVYNKPSLLNPSFLVI